MIHNTSFAEISESYKYLIMRESSIYTPSIAWQTCLISSSAIYGMSKVFTKSGSINTDLIIFTFGFNLLRLFIYPSYECDTSVSLCGLYQQKVWNVWFNRTAGGQEMNMVNNNVLIHSFVGLLNDRARVHPMIYRVYIIWTNLLIIGYIFVMNIDYSQHALWYKYRRIRKLLLCMSVRKIFSIAMQSVFFHFCIVKLSHFNFIQILLHWQWQPYVMYCIVNLWVESN